jgi:hypothetical protein
MRQPQYPTARNGRTIFPKDLEFAAELLGEPLTTTRYAAG